MDSNQINQIEAKSRLKSILGQLSPRYMGAQILMETPNLVLKIKYRIIVNHRFEHFHIHKLEYLILSIKYEYV